MNFDFTEDQQDIKRTARDLLASRSSLERVLKCSVFLVNLGDFGKMNAVYATFFPKDPPARATVEVSHLPKDALVEIECIAAVGK